MILEPPIIHPVSYRLLLFDADNTLRHTVVDGLVQNRPPNKPGEWELLPNVQETLGRYNWKKIGVGIVSNQGGVGLGFLSLHMAYYLLTETLAEATCEPIGPLQVWLCPHAPQDRCACRKPAPLLLKQAQIPWRREGLLHGPGEVLYVGDMDSDREAAECAGIDFCYAADFFGWGANMTAISPEEEA